MAGSFLIRGSSNIVLNSQNTTAPDLTNTAFSVTRDLLEGYVELPNALTCETDVDYTFTLFVRNNNSTRLVLRIGESLTDNYTETVYNLVEEVVESGPQGTGEQITRLTSAINEIGRGWYAIQTGFRFSTRTNISIFATSRVGSGETTRMTTETGTITPTSSFSVGPTGMAVTWPGPTPPWPNGALVTFTDASGAGTGFEAVVQFDADSNTEGTSMTAVGVAQSTALGYSYAGTETTFSEITLTGNDSDPSSFFFWNPMLERRRFEDSGSYLGSSRDNRLSIPDTSFTYLPLWRSETSAVTYANEFTGLTETIDIAEFDVDVTTDFSTADAVEYVRIPADITHGFPSQVTVFDRRGNERVIRLEKQPVYDKREPILITFINKEGVLEDIWAIRKSVENLSVKTDKYYRNIIDYNNLSYDPTRHTSQQYNTVSRKAITVNTDFFPEAYNQFFEQLFHSENVWLTYGGRTRAVMLADKNFLYKTHVNDKLVQYTLVFEYSNRLDNTIK